MLLSRTQTKREMLRVVAQAFIIGTEAMDRQGRSE
jgi:hypothetical protein